MSNAKISGMSGRPLLDIASYARRGPGRRDRLSPTELAHISRTVRRVPEMVNKTAEELVADGRAKDVLRYIDMLSVGPLRVTLAKRKG